ncbi:hypothetical protein RchiOBHm_Chr6g0282031 [Rosa chinensis]|uniref:Uncharacterized protein n=1 Tax=Rosa chinensis TaxID=74649 RepID=A0A2P6PTP5_ROSCH|nr:hypothetical protein RchiOBHm_Chr6g0282031 [Rosa chinensis]
MFIFHSFNFTFEQNLSSIFSPFACAQLQLLCYIYICVCIYIYMNSRALHKAIGCGLGFRYFD